MNPKAYGVLDIWVVIFIYGNIGFGINVYLNLKPVHILTASFVG